MSSNSRWFLDTQHSFSCKAEHELMFNNVDILDNSFDCLNYKSSGIVFIELLITVFILTISSCLFINSTVVAQWGQLY